MEKDFSVLRMLLISLCVMFVVWALTFVFSLWGGIYGISFGLYVILNLSNFAYTEWKWDNPKPLLSKKKQIKVLKYAIEYYDDGFCMWDGLCSRLKNGLYKNNHNTRPISIYEINLYIPSFTRENCNLLAEKYGFEKPHDENEYWWVRYDNVTASTPRLACLKALLTELKK